MSNFTSCTTYLSHQLLFLSMNNNSGSSSFARRITRRVIFTVFITMTAVAALISFILIKRISNQVNAHHRDVMEITNEEMDIWLSVVEVSALNIEDEVKYNLASPDRVLFALSDEMRLSPYILGAGVGFEPYYFPEKGKWFEPYATRDSLGKITAREIGGEKHDYFNLEWYSVPMEVKEGYWTNPYWDDAGAGGMICSYALPQRDLHKNIVGVLGLDLDLNWLKTQLEEDDRLENSRGISRRRPGDPRFAIFSFILGNNGEYIVHPDESRLLTKTYFDFAPQDDKAKEVYLRAGYDMMAGNTGVARMKINDRMSFVFYGPLKSTGWSMGIVVPEITILLPGLMMGLVILLLIIIGILITAAVCHINVRRATKPLGLLADSAREVAKGNFDTRLPDIPYHDEIRNLRDSFENMQHSLAGYIDQVMSATAQRAAIERELGVARNIQMALLPKTFPPFPERTDIDIYASLTPAKAVGGDLYDFFIKDEKLLFCIGDVSGKGVPASMVMAGISTQLRSIAHHHSEPDVIVSALNEGFSLRNESMMFSTLFVGMLDLATGELVYSNAGHNPPLLLCDGTKELEVHPNLPIGIDAEWTFDLQRTHLVPGTTILLYTDGLTEAENSSQELFGEERLLEVTAGLGSKGAEEVVSTITGAVHKFVAGAEQSDDLTIMAIKWQNSASNS